MKTKTLYLAAGAAFIWFALGQSEAATIPAGALLVVRTLSPISSGDQPGTPFQAQLETNVTGGGKVLLPAGTQISGKVVTSRRLVTSSQRLTVNLTGVHLGGHTVPIKTTGAYQLNNNSFKTRRGVPVSQHSYVVAAGRKMEFRLAEPFSL